MDWRRKANGARANSCLSFPLVKNCGPRRSSPPGDPASLFIEQFELLRLESLVEKIFPKRWRGGESKFNARPVKELRFDAQAETAPWPGGEKKGWTLLLERNSSFQKMEELRAKRIVARSKTLQRDYGSTQFVTRRVCPRARSSAILDGGHALLLSLPFPRFVNSKQPVKEVNNVYPS